MIRTILRSGDKILRTKSKPVVKIDKKVLSLITDLKDTLNAQVEPEGVGLAAPQIGVNLRVFLIKPEEKHKVFINPEILEFSDKPNLTKIKKKDKKIMEGCLSLPNFYSAIDRKFSVKIKYLDEQGTQKTETYIGIDAQILQHEVDHLNGMLFVDHVLKQKKKLYEYEKGEWTEVDL